MWQNFVNVMIIWQCYDTGTRWTFKKVFVKPQGIMRHPNTEWVFFIYFCLLKLSLYVRCCMYVSVCTFLYAGKLDKDLVPSERNPLFKVDFNTARGNRLYRYLWLTCGLQIYIPSHVDRLSLNHTARWDERPFILNLGTQLILLGCIAQLVR